MPRSALLLYPSETSFRPAQYFSLAGSNVILLSSTGRLSSIGSMPSRSFVLAWSRLSRATASVTAEYGPKDLGSPSSAPLLCPTVVMRSLQPFIMRSCLALTMSRILTKQGTGFLSYGTRCQAALAVQNCKCLHRLNSGHEVERPGNATLAASHGRDIVQAAKFEWVVGFVLVTQGHPIPLLGLPMEHAWIRQSGRHPKF